MLQTWVLLQMFWEALFSTLWTSTWRVQARKKDACPSSRKCNVFTEYTTPRTGCPHLHLECSDEKSKKKSWPKIRARAGEARSLISFNKLIVEKLCVKDDQFEAKLRQTARALEGCYSCLSLDTWTKELLENNARKFAQYFLALTKMDGNKYFRAKPKLHAFLEISRSPVSHSKTWSYRDESFGHTMSQYAKRRGGEFSVLAVSKGCC